MSMGVDGIDIDSVSAGVSSVGANQGFDPALPAQFEASLQSARQNNVTAWSRYASNDSPWQPDQTKTDAAPGIKAPPSDAPVAPPNNSQPNNTVRADANASPVTNVTNNPPANPYVRGAQETEEAWQQRVTDATNDAIHRYKSDPKGATEDLRKINGAIAQSPGFAENYPAHAQLVSPDFFHNPTAYNAREVSDPASEIPNVSDRIAHFTAANESPYRAIAADGKVYDISRAGVRTDGHWTTSLYDHNDQMIRYSDQQEKGPSPEAFWAAAGLGVGGTRQPGAVPRLSGPQEPAVRPSNLTSNQAETAAPAARQLAADSSKPKVSPPTGADIQNYRKEIGVPQRQTVAVGRADVEINGKAAPFNGKDFDFKDAAPRVRTEAGLPQQEAGDINSPAQDIRGQRHAEQGVFNQLVKALKDQYPDLKPVQVNGVDTYPQVKGTFYIHQSNPRGICPTCIQGVANPKTEPGVFLQASRIFPNVDIVASTEIVPGVSAAPGSRFSFTLRNGEYVNVPVK